MKSRFIQALNCQNFTERPPVWLMRQAGRYMPQYRALRSKYRFLEMIHQPELIAEVTEMPIKAFQMDAAILFSDILVIAEAFKVGLRFDDGAGPVIDRPVRSSGDVERLMRFNVQESLSFVAEGIKLLKSSLHVPLIGFCGAPFTLASYMIEGGSSRDLKLTKQWLWNDPHSFHQLLQKITEPTIEYLNLQIEAGVEAIQIFDSWANYLTYPQFQEFSLQYLKQILKGIKQKEIPVIVFCKGSSIFAPLIAALGPKAISLDWNGDLALLRRAIDSKIALQGNLDPDALKSSKDRLKQEILRILKSMNKEPGYIFNLGHGILPETPYDNVKLLVDTVKEYSWQK